MSVKNLFTQRRYDLDWLRVLAILGFGMRHLTRSTPFLKYANQALRPI